MCYNYPTNFVIYPIKLNFLSSWRDFFYINFLNINCKYIRYELSV